MLPYGWTGWQYFGDSPLARGDSPWLAATTDGAAATDGATSRSSHGRASWRSDITLAASRSNTSSFGPRWWIYAHVLWQDGHVTTHWQSACAS